MQEDTSQAQFPWTPDPALRKLWKTMQGIICHTKNWAFPNAVNGKHENENSNFTRKWKAKGSLYILPQAGLTSCETKRVEALWPALEHGTAQFIAQHNSLNWYF